MSVSIGHTVGRDVEAQLDILAQRMCQKGAHAFHVSRHIEALGMQRLAAGKGEQALC